MSQDRDRLLAEAVGLRESDRTEEARELLLTLSDRYPQDAEVAYQAAWAHDKLGLEAEAVPFYERSLATAGLSPEDRAGAFLGLGSTLRALGRYEDAVTTLRRGLAEFPDDAALQTFLAMAMYNVGQARESVSLLLKLLAETSGDERVRRYRRAIEFYAQDLDAIG
ncbi:tetratricopeptide (TPR) repeat protein [Hamadaea flava]|uniref:Tetratricopeptide repeat protein n=1 Tax=Hamadaea flava TaxID=1742688 RepID=A0ABV8LWQ0_9ACTN|nr:tetratricopeptide repeat protein [Hamadaea flava]MCP2329518.1 tetratricopeptide (TPR) repeat protein [Hamadaea flava]